MGRPTGTTGLGGYKKAGGNQRPLTGGSRPKTPPQGVHHVYRFLHRIKRMESGTSIQAYHMRRLLLQVAQYQRLVARNLWTRVVRADLP